MALLVVTVLLLALYAGLIYFYYHNWQQAPTFEPASTTLSAPFISVIVAARNEEATLPALLNALKSQIYPAGNFEIIIVDDFSTDNTQNVLKPFLSHQVVCIQPAADAAASSKKKAIEAGVQKANGSLLVITDADCLPPPEWLSIMATFHQQNGAVFIAAPVAYTHNNSVLHLFQALDFLTLQGITAASVTAGWHSMCNGANLAYTKQAFEAVQGFNGIDQVASGDDMLLMHKIKKAYPSSVHYLKHKAAIVRTEPMLTWKDFVRQRRRWASKTAYYDDKNVFYVLLFVYLLNLHFLVLLVALFFNPFYLYVLVGYLFFKTAIEWPFVASVAKFYDEKDLMPYFPLMQPLHILYTITVGLLSQLGAYQWKGRKLK